MSLSHWFSVGLSAYLLLAAAWDLRTMRVPNWLTLPALGGVLAWRLVHLDVSFLPFWAACLVSWYVHVLGGGDVKLLMVLFGLFPEVELVYALLIGAAVILALLVLWRRARIRKLRMFLVSVGHRVLALDFFPPARALQVQGEPFTFVIALVGIVYVWWARGVWV